MWERWGNSTLTFACIIFAPRNHHVSQNSDCEKSVFVMGEKGCGRGGVIVHLPLHALSLPPEIIMSPKTLIVRRVSL